MLNSDEVFYLVPKYKVQFATKLNLTRVFHGAPGGGPFSPEIFDSNNRTNNPPRDSIALLGHIAALWNDFGPNATTYSEAYYAWRDGLPALADKQWGGKLLEAEYRGVFDTLHAAVPGQNLDRAIPTNSRIVFQYEFNGKRISYSEKTKKTTIRDRSTNHYDGVTDCRIAESLELTGGCSLMTPLRSKGRNYTLSFNIKPRSSSPGPIFTGPDSQLLFGTNTSKNIMLVSGSTAYQLNYTFPVGKWTQASLVGLGDQTFLKLEGGPEMEFEIKLGLYGALNTVAPMAIEAPLARIGGNSFEGEMEYLKLTCSTL